MAEVSRNLVAVLLILVIVVSGFGAWSMFSRNAQTSAGTTSAGDATASVQMAINHNPTPEASFNLQVAGAGGAHG